MVFCILHLIVGFLKSVTKHPSVLLTSICLSLASSLMSFSFETWMVSEHEKVYLEVFLLVNHFIVADMVLFFVCSRDTGRIY